MDQPRMVRKFVRTCKFDDYIDKDGNLIKGLEYDSYITYSEFLVATVVEQPNGSGVPAGSSQG